jgi:hypothetical protein
MMNQTDLLSNEVMRAMADSNEPGLHRSRDAIPVRRLPDQYQALAAEAPQLETNSRWNTAVLACGIKDLVLAVFLPSRPRSVFPRPGFVHRALDPVASDYRPFLIFGRNRILLLLSR